MKELRENENGRPNRRKFLKSAGVVGVGALAGCIGDDDPGEDGDDDDDMGADDGDDDVGQDDDGDEGTDGPVDGGTLRVGYEADLTGLDPHNISSVVSWNVIYNVCETLVTFEDGEPAGRLVDDFEIDGTTYTFHLKEGVQFHDGYGEMTAEDVVYSFDRMMDEDASTAPDLNANIEDVTAVDDYQIDIDLQGPFGPFLQYLARVHWVVVPEEAVEDQGGEINDFQEPVGTGPFVFEEYTPDNNMVMSAFDDYHVDDVPHVDEVELIITPDPDSRVLALENDDLDFVRNVPGRAAEGVENNEDTKLELTEGSGWAMIHLNPSVEPWDDPAVRRAAAHVIDRDAVIQTALFGYGSAGVQPFPEGNFWNYDLDNERWHDLDEAQRILDEAGNPLEGETVEIKITGEYAIQEAMGEIIQANFAEIGVDVDLNNQEWGTHLNDFIESNFGALSFSVPYKVDPDRHYYGFLEEGGYNKYGDDQPDAERIRELLEEGRNELDTDARKEIYAELEWLVQEHVPWISVTHTDDINGLRANVHGFEEWTLPYDRYWTMWIDQ